MASTIVIMSVVFRCILGPTLYRIYRASGPRDGEKYIGNTAERYTNAVTGSISAALNISVYVSPVILGWMYKRDFFTPDGLVQICKFLAGLGFVYVAAVNIRGFARAFNPVYREFIHVLARASRNLTPEAKSSLARYDFDFAAWPLEFDVLDNDGDDESKKYSSRTFVGAANPVSWRDVPLKIVSWLMVHSFGMKLVYPGSIRLLQASISGPLEEGRAKWVMDKAGQRFKLRAADGNFLDTMFFDRRPAKGTTLVISCDGNAGFYEIGVLGTPMEAGYSVLGWNHPGFGGSTGSPYPLNEANAVDAVMQFAIKRLGFMPEDIVLHGWSIGGYTASWIAMNYPDIKAVVVDATFDNLLPLAVPRMPKFFESLVKMGVSQYVNLNVADQLKKFHGPIRLIRRTHDEMITTEPEVTITNRGNNLLIELLKYRYPSLVGDEETSVLWQYLGMDENGQRELLTKDGVNEDALTSLVKTDMEESRRSFPTDLGIGLDAASRTQLTLFLASKFMTEFDAAHCTPLPVSHFILPWDPTENESFVKV